MATKLLKKRHILIAGGTGYIGSYLSSKLTKAGHKVISASRNISKDENNICIDLTNEKDVIELGKKISNIDIIIHCAAIAHGERPPKNYSVADFNTTITENLLKGFEGHQSHWIFISSISVCGDLYSELKIPITFSPKSADNYGSGKIRDENLLISRCKHLDILRLMPVYDNENLQDIKKRVFLPKTNIKIIIRPSPLYSICNIEKVLSAVQKSMNYSYGQRIAHVGDSQPISQNELSSWFTGKAILVPQLLFKFLFFLLPKKLILFRKIAFMLKKLGLNNIYEIGVREIHLK